MRNKIAPTKYNEQYYSMGLTRNQRLTNWLRSKFGSENDIIIKMLEPKSYEKIVDCGCGLGGFTRELSEHCEAIGIDGSSYAIQKSKKTYPNLTFLETNLTMPLHFKFDKAVSKYVIEHLSRYDALKMYQNVYDSLQNGGKFVLVCPIEEFAWSRRFLRFLINHKLDPTHIRNIKLKELLNDLKSVGFKFLEIRKMCFFTPFRWGFGPMVTNVVVCCIKNSLDNRRYQNESLS